MVERANQFQTLTGFGPMRMSERTIFDRGCEPWRPPLQRWTKKNEEAALVGAEQAAKELHQEINRNLAE
jgi:hypothetical protein